MTSKALAIWMVTALSVGPLAGCQKKRAQSGKQKSPATKHQRPQGPKQWTLKHRHELTGHELGVEGLTFSPDGKWLVSGAYDKTVRVWNLERGKLKRTFTIHQEWVPAVAFHPTDQLVASGSGDKTIFINRVNKRTEPIEIKEHNGVHALAFDPAGEHLAAAGFGGGLRLWHVRSGDWRRTFKGHASDVFAVAFSPDGKRLSSGSADRTVRIWNPRTGKELHVMEGHTDWVHTLAFSSDGKHLHSVSRDRTIRTWDVATGKPAGKVSIVGPPVRAAAFGPKCRLALVATDKLVRLVDASTGFPIRALPEQAKRVTAVAIGPQGKRLAWGLADGTIQIWSAEETNELPEDK